VGRVSQDKLGRKKKKNTRGIDQISLTKKVIKESFDKRRGKEGENGGGKKNKET